MKSRSKWTADEKEFDRLLSMSESRDQMARINGRLRLRSFLERFTQQQQEQMAESIGARKKGGGAR